MFAFLTRSRVDIEGARELVRQGATLLDVRTPQEFSGGHVQGAVNIPVQSLAARHQELPDNRAVVVYCRSGGRSASAARLLRQAGFKEVIDVGPMPRW